MPDALIARGADVAIRLPRYFPTSRTPPRSRLRMILAQVIGTVVSSRKEASIEGFKLMAVQPVGSDLKPSGPILVAVDAVGAGIGETVLIVSGSSARYTEVTSGKPADASILAIVDLIETAGGRIYSKASA